jgi:phosphoglycolate phosphatase-like HAD superfamily hydrolase
MRTVDGRVSTIRNIIWDVDGTLFDTYPAISRAFRAALHEFGEDASLERITALARDSLGHCTTTLVEEYRLDEARFEAAVDRHYESTKPEDQPPFPGAKEVCEHICQVGGQNVIVTHRGPQGTAELLSASGLSGLFSGCITRADAYPRKPDPASFNAIIERHGLTRAATMSIGDRDIDVLAGKAAGIVTCFFGQATAGVDADLAITDFGELADLLTSTDPWKSRSPLSTLRG